MPLTVFHGNGISATRRERIETEAAGQRLAQPYDGWIAADPFRGSILALITGPRGFGRTVAFARDGSPVRRGGGGRR
jgi:hypothetical protein